VPTQGELSSPFEQDQTRRAAEADAADKLRIRAIEKADLAGIMEGYGGTSHISQGPNGYSASGGTLSPGQKMATAQREAEVAKSRIPIEQAGVSGATQLGVANIQGQNQRDIELMKEKQATERAHDALKQMLGVPLEEGDTLSLPGGGALKRGAASFPTGPAGVALEQAIQKRMNMEKEPGALAGIGNFFAPGHFGPQTEDKAAAERALDAQFPEWRKRMDPGFKFATPGATPARVPGTGPTPAAVPQAAAPGPAAQMAAVQSGGNDPGTQRAIAALQANGIPVTPEFIAEAKRQLGIQ
jgi:hypothetical protein